MTPMQPFSNQGQQSYLHFLSQNSDIFIFYFYFMIEIYANKIKSSKIKLIQ